jgi:hypothetical protein
VQQHPASARQQRWWLRGHRGAVEQEEGRAGELGAAEIARAIEFAAGDGGSPERFFGQFLVRGDERGRRKRSHNAVPIPGAGSER